MFDFTVAGHVVPIFLLVLTGFTVGVVGGFIGVGGGYMVTPALIVFGFPGYMASGTDACHIAGKSVISSIRHRQLGNIDWTLALGMVGGTMLGVELGVRLLVYTKNIGLSGVVLLAASVDSHVRPLHLHPDRDPEVPQEDGRGPEGRQGSRPRSEGQQAAPLLPEHPHHAHHQMRQGARWSSRCGSS